MCEFIKVSLCAYLYAFIGVSWLQLTFALSKTWIQNENWEATKNWNLERLPCPGDTVNIDRAGVEIFLNSTSTIEQLIFRQNGSIVLGNSAEIIFEEEHADSEECKTGEISFVGSGSNDWFDPHNWKTDSKSIPVGLYSQLLPCQYDDVRFPKDSSYNVEISKSVTVAKVFINGKEHNETEFQRYTKSHTGVQRFQLKNSASFHITGKKCQDVSGCICNNNKYEDYICSFVTCPEVKCGEPVKPYGGCCSICGHLLLVNYSVGFTKEFLEKQIKKLLKKFPEVTFTSMKYKRERIEIVLWDETTSGSGSTRTTNAARSLRENLLADKNSHVTAVEILPKPPSSESSKSEGITPIKISFIAVGSFVFFILVILLLFLLKRKSRNIAIDETQMEGEPSNLDHHLSDDDGVNPLYECGDIEMDSLGFTNALAVEDPDSEAKENPLYESAVPSSTE
ncbi:protein amnionless-like [Dendronephthya gigantea]|uniref:protein amnionless-like n=1 Tax=Dendronephthya gigantea TaxID=151771 RepID=UPI00106A07EB|nr:protein amnionless-like [Dendronephthya gigantea]